MQIPDNNVNSLKEWIVLNIASNSENPTEALLSNLAHAPFELDNQQYASVEGFWQGLKFPDEEKRLEIASLYGIESKKIGNDAPQSTTFKYRGEVYDVGSIEHQELMLRAIRAKLEYNPAVLKLLIDSGDTMIIHRPMKKDGTAYADSTTIPGQAFSQILMNLRAEYQSIFVQEAVSFNEGYEEISMVLNPSILEGSATQKIACFLPDFSRFSVMKIHTDVSSDESIFNVPKNIVTIGKNDLESLLRDWVMTTRFINSRTHFDAYTPSFIIDVANSTDEIIGNLKRRFARYESYRQASKSVALKKSEVGDSVASLVNAT